MSHVTKYVCQHCPDYNCLTRLTATLHNMLEHEHHSLDETFLIFRDWNNPRQLENGMPHLPGWIVVVTPQPIVQISRLTVEVPCKKSKLASAEQPNQVASNVLAEPMSINSELVSAMPAKGGGFVSNVPRKTIL